MPIIAISNTGIITLFIKDLHEDEEVEETIRKRNILSITPQELKLSKEHEYMECQYIFIEELYESKQKLKRKQDLIEKNRIVI